MLGVMEVIRMARLWSIRLAELGYLGLSKRTQVYSSVALYDPKTLRRSFGVRKFHMSLHMHNEFNWREKSGNR